MLQNLHDEQREISKLYYNNKTLLISGSQLKFSDIPTKEERIKNSLPIKGEIIKFFAKEQIIIDRDINEIGDEMNIVIIAPICQVDGFRIINLDGSSGKVHAVTQAKNGTNYNLNGENGKSGVQGGRGGSFYGICQIFINVENLIINANGGNGSPGQNGVDGINLVENGTGMKENCQNGTFGENDNVLKGKCYNDTDDGGNCKNGTIEIENGTNVKNGNKETIKCQNTAENNANCKNVTNGKSDKNGTNGTISVVYCKNATNGYLNKTNGVVKFQNGTMEIKNGKNGTKETSNNENERENVDCKNGTIYNPCFENGKNGTVGGKGGDGGPGGAGGKGGEIIVIILENSKNIPKISVLNGSIGAAGDGGKGGKGNCNSKIATDGDNGNLGKSLLDFKFLSNKSDEFNFLQIVNDFKFYSQWHLINFNPNNNFEKFYHLFVKEMKNYTNIFGFIDEFLYLEKLYFLHDNKSILIDFYQSLQQRLSNFSKMEYRDILEKLENNLTTRILNRKLITNKTMNNLIELKEMIKIRNKICERVNQTKEIITIKNFLNDNFVKIKNFISLQINEKLTNFINNVDEKIINLIQNCEKNNKELEKKLQERFSLETLYLTTIAVEFTIPMIFVLFVINLYNNSIDQKIPLNVEEYYDEIYKRYENYISQRVVIIRNHINFVEEKKKFINNTKENKNDEQFKTLTIELENFLKNLTSSYWIKKEPFKWEIEILMEEERKLNYYYTLSENDSSSSNQLNIIEYLKLDSKCGQIFGESYKKFLNKGLINEIQKIVNNSNFNYLEEIRNKMLHEILPDLNDLRINFGMTDDNIKIPLNSKKVKMMISLDGLLNGIYFEIGSIVYRDWHNGNYDFFGNNLRKTIEDIRGMISQLFKLRRISKDRGNFTSDLMLNYKLSLLDLQQQNNFIRDYYLDVLSKFKGYDFYKEEIVRLQNNSIVNSEEREWIEILKMNQFFDSEIDRIDRITDRMVEVLEEEKKVNLSGN